MILRISFFIISILFTFIGFSQYYKVNGQLLNSKTNSPLKGATIKVRSITDSTTLTNGISDSLGRFSIDNLKPDSFQLVIWFPVVFAFHGGLGDITIQSFDKCLPPVNHVRSNLCYGVSIFGGFPKCICWCYVLQYLANRIAIPGLTIIYRNELCNVMTYP